MGMDGYFRPCAKKVLLISCGSYNIAEVPPVRHVVHHQGQHVMLALRKCKHNMLESEKHTIAHVAALKVSRIAQHEDARNRTAAVRSLYKEASLQRS
jgi:capsular polysaccharide biosynthesis protein